MKMKRLRLWAIVPAVCVAAAASSRAADPAPVNPYNGMQEREEIFEFAAKPTVKVEGTGTDKKWIITFASKAACDATVSIVDKEGKVIRHLASGVLGKNAPHPFQQNSLSQRIEWDGLKDDFTKADTAGVVVRVSLGLQAKHERDIAWDPAPGSYLEKDGAYFRTFWPPPADLPPDKWAELGLKLATTVWGDKVPYEGWFSPFAQAPDKAPARARSLVEELFGDKKPPRKADFANRPGVAWYTGNPRIAADALHEKLYVISPGGSPGGILIRLDGKTGEVDKSWFGGETGKNAVLRNAVEVDVGPGGMVYVGGGAFGYLRFIFRLNTDGKPVPFPDTTEQVPAGPMAASWWDKAPSLITRPAGDPFVLTHLWATGVGGHSNVHDKGFDVNPAGKMVCIVEGITPEWAAKHDLAGNLQSRFVQVWNADGKLLSAEAVGRAGNWGHGARMDRDGNLYLVRSGILPAGQDKLEGVTDVKAGYRVFGGHGTLLKFRGLGDQFPLDVGPGVKVGRGEEIKGAVWAYGGMTDAMVPDCSCNHSRFELDAWARSWIPARQLCSIVVLDSNGNRVARIGRYGNVDDEGIRIAWVRAVAVSDTALYALDCGNRRILKAALSYAASEDAPLPKE